MWYFALKISYFSITCQASHDAPVTTYTQWDHDMVFCGVEIALYFDCSLM
jgi:hypothetical protein